jgi:glycosyltransferase involved in cell wall biosynthesis
MVVGRGRALFAESGREAASVTLVAMDGDEPTSAATGVGAVTVVICTRNRAAVLDRCLATIAGISGGDRADVLVVDNGSTDETDAVVDRWAAMMPQLRSVCEPRTGLSHARNTALDHARGDVVAFLDDDVLVDAGWLDGLIDAYRRRPGIAGVAGRVELDWPDGRPSWLPERREVWFARLDLGTDSRLLADDEYPVGANMSVRRELARAAGGFDPGLGYSGTQLLGNEERDFFARIRRAGHSLAYEPACHVVHVVGGARVTRRYLFRRLYAQGRGDVRADKELVRAGRRHRLGVARRALSRGLLRGWRNDLRRIARPGSRHLALVDVVAGRAKQLGVAREALTTTLRGRRT